LKTRKFKKNFKKTICAFLNNDGGRIYIGINDYKQVVGIKLNPKDQDDMTNAIANYVASFNYDCRHTHISTFFLPVKDSVGQYIENLWVAKVIVRQGDPSLLYSVTNIGINAYYRMQRQNIALKADQILVELKQRQTKPKNPRPASDFEDEAPEKPRFHSMVKLVETPHLIKHDSTRKDEFKKVEHGPKKIEAKPKPVVAAPPEPKTNLPFPTYGVVILGLPIDVKEDEVLKLFKSYPLSTKAIAFKSDNQKTANIAFVNFKHWKDAHQFVIENNKRILIRDKTYSCTMCDKILDGLPDAVRKLYEL